jgi:hypothetical protein
MRYPIYIISKGRWEKRLTARALEKIGVSYRIVIEPQEYEQYSAVIDPGRILVLPFSDLGQGSIPARNWVWEHSIAAGDKRHWILDDNIKKFSRFNRNNIVPVGDGTIFSLAEIFTDRFSNVPKSGFQYYMFVRKRFGGANTTESTPFRLNTRIYSCILLSNEFGYRWRGRYNEDTDLSLRMLKDGYCTILFNAFIADKMTTMLMKGGNTDKLYQGDGRLEMARSLQRQHPDVVKITRKWGRWQHHVDYRPFAGNRLILRRGVTIEPGINNYGMTLKELAA